MNVRESERGRERERERAREREREREGEAQLHGWPARQAHRRSQTNSTSNHQVSRIESLLGYFYRGHENTSTHAKTVVATLALFIIRHESFVRKDGHLHAGLRRSIFTTVARNMGTSKQWQVRSFCTECGTIGPSKPSALSDPPDALNAEPLHCTILLAPNPYVPAHAPEARDTISYPTNAGPTPFWRMQSTWSGLVGNAALQEFWGSEFRG